MESRLQGCAKPQRYRPRLLLVIFSVGVAVSREDIDGPEVGHTGDTKSHSCGPGGPERVHPQKDAASSE